MTPGASGTLPTPDRATPTAVSSTLGRLRSDLFAYGVLLAVPKILVLLTVPVYTRRLSTAQYGGLQFGIAMAMVLAPIFTLGLDSAQSYFFFAKQPDGTLARPHVVSAVLKIRMLWGSGFFACALVALLYAPRGQFLTAAFPWYLVVATAGAFLEQLSGQAADVFRLLHRPGAYAVTTGLQALGGAILGVLLGVGLGWGVTGIFLGSASAAALTAASAWFRHRALLDFAGDRVAWWPRLLKFGLPILPASFGQILLYSLDRWLLVAFKGPTDLAVYGAGVELAGVIALVVAGFRVAWWPIAMAEINDDRTEVFSRVATLYVGIAAMVGVVSAYAFPIATRWLLPSRYAPASAVAAIIPWRWLCYGFFLIGSVGTWKSERTAWTVVPVGIGLAVNAAGGALVIPLWGIQGAAWSAVAGSLAWVISAMIISERLFHVGYPHRILALQTTIGLATTAMLIWLSTSAASGAGFLRVLVVGAALLILSTTIRSAPLTGVRSRAGR